jgi:hypothetical protein
VDIEREQLRRDLRRFRHLLHVNTDPQAIALLAEMNAIAKERLRLVQRKFSVEARSKLH